MVWSSGPGTTDSLLLRIEFIKSLSSLRSDATSLPICVLASSTRVMRVVADVLVFTEVADRADVVESMSTSCV